MHESFAHLHVHSDYTLSKGGSKVKHLVAAAKKSEVPAIALVDDGNMFGAMEFSKYGYEEGIQPIIGAKLWFSTGGKDKGSIILLAKDDVGYTNLCYLLAQSNRPRGDEEGGLSIIPADTLHGRVDGLIALTGGHDGCLVSLLKEGRDEDAAGLLNWLRGEFNDRLYIEICRHGDENELEVAVEEKLIDMAYAPGELECADGVVRDSVPLVATTEVWYATPDRHDTFEILKAVESKGKVTIQDGNIVPSSARRFYLRSPQEMKDLFADLPEAFGNAASIAQRCAFKVTGRAPILPTYSTEAGRSEAEEMRIQARAGLEKRLAVLKVTGDARKPYEDRLEFELKVIEGMKFPGYFLIVSDFINWAKEQDIPVGPGRGSGAGSLVAYSLFITDLDPLRFDLLFERFLNPERVSMPDFDIDFCQDRRGEVMRYVREKYGDEYVSMIATFGEIKSKTAVKDVGRVMQSDAFGGYGYGELDTITKLIPMDGPEPKKLADALADPDDQMFRQHIDSDDKYRVLINSAMKIEGLFRSQGLHAAGFVISGLPLNTLVPVGWDTTSGMPVCQFNMKFAEAAGLVKFDFLGLKTLSVIHEALAHIKKTTGKVIDLGTLPLDDEETYKMLAKGDSNGVFQLEGEGMKKQLKALMPKRFEEIVALTALFRPGPMEMIPHFIDCKNGKVEPNYPEPVERTKPFLEETFGIMVYQEQVMQVAQVVAGYSLGGADMLRRAMGKKIPAEMAAQRHLFIEGAVKNGTTEKEAGALFDLIAKFAGYGFNKSHAAAYTLLSYHTAWLKRHYPAEFLAALLTYETSDPKKMAKIKEDMDSFEVKMLPPSIDYSEARFQPEKDGDKQAVRFGLTAIKGISGDLSVLREARKAGPFLSLTDFYTRAGTQFNKGQLEKLVEAGAFDSLAKNRYSAKNVLDFLSRGGKKTAAGQEDLFGGALEIRVPKEVEDVKEWGNRIDREFNAVGFYFAEHPLDTYEPKFKKVKVKRKASLKTWMLENNKAELKGKRLAGIVDLVLRKTSKKSNKPYIWARFAEKRDTFEVNFFGDQDHVEKIRLIIENAKQGRRPVIVVGDLALQDGRDDMTIWGREVLDADVILASERGRMKIIVDAAAIAPSLEEQKLLREAEIALKQGQFDQAQVDAVKASNSDGALKRKVGYIAQTLGESRADEDPNAVEVLLTILSGGGERSMKLAGTYLIDQSLENSLKATDGVVSVIEEV